MHAAVELAAFWAFGFLTLCVAVVLLSIFGGIIDSDMEAYAPNSGAKLTSQPDPIIPHPLKPECFDAGLFPNSLRVLSFIPGKKLLVQVDTRWDWVIIRSLLMGIWLFLMVFGFLNASGRDDVPNWLFASCFAFPFLIYVRHKCSIGFDLEAKKIQVERLFSNPSEALQAPLEVVTKKVKDGWCAELIARVLASGQKKGVTNPIFQEISVVNTPPRASEADARNEVLPFAEGLNYQLGLSK